MFRCVLWEGNGDYCRLYLLPTEILKEIKAAPGWIEKVWREHEKCECLTAEDIWNDNVPEWVEDYSLLPSVVLGFEVFLKPPPRFLPILFFYKQERKGVRGIQLPDEKEIRWLG